MYSTTTYQWSTVDFTFLRISRPRTLEKCMVDVVGHFTLQPMARTNHRILFLGSGLVFEKEAKSTVATMESIFFLNFSHNG